ncbi:hypothetical protein TorRG33x02_299440 [Trema orientale]|uniref:Uncharacterized protein n=1 Tax=Trema orientale TaxID=63057 RepID=A0A2P5C343_TREOI|nr:hypothetical protein TorRG33x02_299440 [Trema orientale]
MTSPYREILCLRFPLPIPSEPDTVRYCSPDLLQLDPCSSTTHPVLANPNGRLAKPRVPHD